MNKKKKEIRDYVRCRNCGEEVAHGHANATDPTDEWNWEICNECGLEVDNGVVTVAPARVVEGKAFEVGKTATHYD